MKVPAVTGIVERRILVNYTVDPDIAKSIVRAPFTPKIINGKAITGICIIRLKQMRPKGLPAFIGFRSENGARCIAVEWIESGRLKEGVYVPGRDTSSLFNTLSGRRIFQGRHSRAKFDVREEGDDYRIALKSSYGTIVSVDARLTGSFNPQSIFKGLSAAAAFFKAGSTGYSPNGVSMKACC